MSWRAHLYAWLVDHADLTDLIGRNVYPMVAPPGTRLPYIVWQQVSGNEGTTWDGGRNPSFPIIQFTCWASDMESAAAIREILRVRIEGETIGGSAFSIRDEVDNEDTSVSPTVYGALLEVRVHG